MCQSKFTIKEKRRGTVDYEGEASLHMPASGRQEYVIFVPIILRIIQGYVKAVCLSVVKL